MASFTLFYKKPAVKDIQALPPQIRQRLGKKLAFFAAQDDPLSFAKPLTKPADAQYRFRVGSYRVLFDIEANRIVILRVQHRSDVYQK